MFLTEKKWVKALAMITLIPLGLLFLNDVIYMMFFYWGITAFEMSQASLIINKDGFCQDYFLREYSDSTKNWIRFSVGLRSASNIVWIPLLFGVMISLSFDFKMASNENPASAQTQKGKPGSDQPAILIQEESSDQSKD